MSKSNPRPTPIDTLVNLYKKHNKSSLDINHLLCSTCNTWLIKPIYIKKNGFNVCGNCANATKEECILNVSLEHLLEGGQYPCKFNAYGCKVFDTLIQNHEERCSYNMRCFCQELVGNNHTLIEHLKEQHSMETLQLTKPVADVSLKNQDMKKSTYHPICLQAGETKLILLKQSTETANELCVSIYNGGDIPRQMEYMLVISCDDITYSKQGKVTNTFLHPAGKTTLTIPNLDMEKRVSVDVKIYLDNYQKFEPIVRIYKTMLEEYECPICLETLVESCYQCTNGHNVCSKCKAMILVCPICRLTINEVCMNIRNLTAIIQNACKYSANGCFAYHHVAEIQAHENQCPMKMRSCDLCKDLMLDKAAFFQHMLVEHEMQTLEDTPAIVKPGYISYKGCVFRMGYHLLFKEASIQVSLLNGVLESSQQLRVSWFLRLIAGSSQHVPDNYTLIIEVVGKSITVNSKVQDDEKMDTICFPMFTKNLPVTLKLCFVEL